MENNNEKNSFIETYKTFHSSFVKKFYFKVFIFGIIMLSFGFLLTIIIASTEGNNTVGIVLIIIGLIVSVTTLSYTIFYWNKWGKTEDILKKQEQEKMKMQQAKVEAQKKEKKQQKRQQF